MTLRFNDSLFRARPRTRRALRAAILVGVLATPAGAGAAVTSLTAGQGVLLSPNPITATGTIALKLPLALSGPFATPFFNISNTGAGVGLLAASSGNDGARASTAGNGHAGISAGDTSSAGGYGGYFTSSHGTGLYATASTVGRSAVWGTDTSVSPGGYGGFFTSKQGVGVFGSSFGADGLYGLSSASDGVYGVTSAAGHAGVSAGDTSSAGGYGGYFTSSHGTGLYANSGSVPAGQNASPGLVANGGAVGAGSTAGGNGGNGVDATGGAPGGCTHSFPPTCFVGGYGLTATGGDGVQSNGIGGSGLIAQGGAGGVRCNITCRQLPGGDGILAYAGAGGSDYAGYFSGDVNVTGTLYASQKNFRIDDPLDPANKFLTHTSVESPQAENVYNGNVTTDAHGFATVTLPPYFEAENRDYRYMLTPIGSNGWNARTGIWKQVAHNQFVIRTDMPHVQVSWTVFGIRNDPYARSHSTPAEQLKPAGQRGRYLYPAGYGKPSTQAIGYRRPTTPRRGSQSLG